MRAPASFASLAAAALLLAACGDDPPLPGPERPGVQASFPAEGGDAGWRERSPHVSILLVGGQRGKMKPCGCTAPQLGGLERLAALVDLLRYRAREGHAAVSLGWSMRGSGEEQEESKATLYRETLRQLGFDAMLLGTPDLLVPAMGQPFEVAPSAGGEGGGEGGGPRGARGGGADVPRPPANVKLAETGSMASAADTDPIASFRVRELEVRVLSIVDPGADLAGAAEVVLPPEGALQALEPRRGAVWIVGTDASGHALQEVQSAARRLGPSIVVDLSRAWGVQRLEGVLLGEEPLLVTFDDLGKEVGILDLEPVRDGPDRGRWRVSFHVQALDPRFDDAPDPSPLRQVVAEDLFGAYKREVRERGYLEGWPNHPDATWKGEPVSYVGSHACAECHEGIYQQYLTTPHAHALETLREVGYAWDPECVRCHVVGFQRMPHSDVWLRVTSGFQTPRKTPLLADVGCESCHGPGSLHVEDPIDRSLWAADGPNRRHPGQQGCTTCHDLENSHGFAEGYETKFLPKVDHREVPSDRRGYGEAPRAPPR